MNPAKTPDNKESANPSSPVTGRFRVAYKMQLFAGCEAAYRQRHDSIWPELKELLKGAGVCDYSIFWDKTTNSLFSILYTSNLEALEKLPSHPVMKKWWNYMKDIMETSEDNSPVSLPLEEMFYLA